MIKKIFLKICCLCLLTSCNDAGEIGLQFFDDDSFEISSFDTLSLEVATVLFDSITTHNRGSVLVGQHTDDQLGVVNAKGYLKLGYPEDTDILSSSSDIEEDAVFDSISIILDYSGYSIYDTIGTQTIHIHLTEETIELDDNFYLFNTSSFPYQDVAIASHTFTPKPLKDASIEFRLPDIIGQDIFNHIENTELLDYIDAFDGLVLIPDESDNGAIVAFASSSSFRIHYHIGSELEPEAFTYDIPLSSTHFSQIQSDKSQTQLANLISQREHLSSSVSNNQAYMQGGVGLAMRVEIPHLTNLLDEDGLILSRAHLEFYPSHSQEESNVSYPESINMYEVNHRNEKLVQWSITPEITIDDELDRETKYRIDVTSFIDNQLLEPVHNEEALLFEIPESSSSNTLDRLYVGDAHSEKPMRLIIYYVKVQ